MDRLRTPSARHNSATTPIQLADASFSLDRGLRQIAWPTLIPVPGLVGGPPSYILELVLPDSLRKKVRDGSIRKRDISCVGASMFARDGLSNLIKEFREAHGHTKRSFRQPNSPYQIALSYYPRLRLSSPEVKALGVPREIFRRERAALRVLSQPDIVAQVLEGGRMRESPERPKLKDDPVLDILSREARAACAWKALFAARGATLIGNDGLVPVSLRTHTT